MSPMPPETPGKVQIIPFPTKNRQLTPKPEPPILAVRGIGDPSVHAAVGIA
jgi:hypothetical protein